VGPRAVLEAVVKRKIPSPRWESNTRTPIVQPVSQRYTYWVITALPSSEVDIQSVRKTSAFHGTRSFITVFTKVLYFIFTSSFLRVGAEHVACM
jgi:hypothetical protein